jgi:hypothetical protein
MGNGEPNKVVRWFLHPKGCFPASVERVACPILTNREDY